MRKLIWCCSTAGVLAAGSFLSIASYAYLYPDSPVGQALMTAARASVAMQPLTGLASLALRATRSETPTCATAGSAEECVPADPQPVELEPMEKIVVEQVPDDERKLDAAPIVIHEDEPMPAEDVVQAVPATIDMNGVQGQDMPPNGCPILMPYCQDEDEQQVTPPPMPYASDDEAKPAKQDEPKADDASEESEQNVFKAWKKIFESKQENNANSAEELPPPTEEEQSQEEPKCEEDPHRHEHYSGCPSTTCPYTGKSYPSYAPATKSGREESSEEPAETPKPHGKKMHSGDAGKSNESCPRTQGVDTMEYRSSDGGLNEYGPSPLH